jgi:hypothetical protein
MLSSLFLRFFHEYYTDEQFFPIILKNIKYLIVNTERKDGIVIDLLHKVRGEMDFSS